MNLDFSLAQIYTSLDEHKYNDSDGHFERHFYARMSQMHDRVMYVRCVFAEYSYSNTVKKWLKW